jgi:rhodanese-related sulfurtransferase
VPAARIAGEKPPAMTQNTDAADRSTHPPVATISREQLQEKLARGDRFKLVMAISAWAFRAKHIPGSLHFDKPADMFAALGQDEEIVVYCSDVDCRASINAVRALQKHGYTRVRHYVGGLIDWEGAGLPLEGDWAAPLKE